MKSSVASRAFEQLSGGKLFRLSSNQMLPLTDPRTAWLVRGGTVEILCASGENAGAVGARRHLFRLPSNRAMFGTLPRDETGKMEFLAIATEHAELLELPFSAVAELVAEGEPVLDDWVHHLSQLLGAGTDQPTSVVRHTESGSFQLGEQEAFASGHKHSLCLRVESGTIAACGHPHLQLTAADEWILVAEGLWFRVTSESAQIELAPLVQLDAPSQAQAMERLHGLVTNHLKWLAECDQRAEIDRRKRSRELEELDTTVAYQDLARVLDPRERFPLRETPLLTSLTAVGESMGIRVSPPAASEDLNRVNDPIEAIARASRVRWRKIILGAEWWKSDSGPLLAYLGEAERKPVALLPRGGVYDIVMPERRVREPLTAALRDEIVPEAYMLYRPLPAQASGVGDLLRFTSRGRLGETLLVLVMGICATLLGMIGPKVTGQLVDVAIPNADQSMLAELAALLTIAGVSTAVLTYIQMMTTVRVSTWAEIVSQSAMWDRLLKFRPDFFRSYSSGDLQTRVDAVGEVNRELNGATLRPLISGVLAILNFLLLWYYSWSLAKIAIWVGVAVLLFSLFFSYLIRRLSIRLHDIDGTFLGLLVQLIGGVCKIRTAGAEYRAFHHWVS
ncbi:MAG: ABC transporter transmembrane domain-containing protein, partial [Pirellulaceae bacterium]